LSSFFGSSKDDLVATEPKQHRRAFEVAALFAVVAGVVLRTIQWVGNPSFWLDEANLAENIVHSPFPELLTEPLRWAQVAPGGFLVVEGVLVRVLGSGEMALRFFPFMGSVVTCVLVWWLARRILSGPGLLVTTLLLALNPFLVSLAGALKQYSTDAMVTTIILCSVVYLMERPRSRRAWFGLAVTLGVLASLSIPSVMVALPGMFALALFGEWEGDRSTLWTKRVPALAVWVVLAGLAGLRANWMVDRMWGGFMNDFWTGSNAFLPPFTEDPTALLDAVRWTLIRPLAFKPYAATVHSHGPLVDTFLTPAMLLLLLGLGVFALAWKGREKGQALSWAILAAGPFLVAVFLSRLEIYPLAPRVWAFSLPLVFLLVGGGTDVAVKLFSFKRAGRWPLIVGGLTAGVVVLPSLKVLVDRPPPFEVVPIRGLLAEVARQRTASEPMFGFWYSDGIFGYYGPRVGLEDGITFSSNGDLAADLSTLDGYKGTESLWVVFPHTYSWDKDVVLCFLDSIGEEVRSVVLAGTGRPLPISAHRFDLSDPEPWADANPQDFPLVEMSYPSCEIG
jgi:hypothetical protein